MEVKFMSKPLQCLRPFYSKVHSQEYTQEIRLPDAFPDIGKVLGCWGQVLLRGKEWRSTSMGANGGVMVWVMYVPEDGTQPRVVDAWIPIQCRWDFPETTDDGIMILRPILTALDGRGVSARKIMVRAGVDTFAQAMIKQTVDVPFPMEVPEDVQMLTRSYPVELPVEAGEKQVQLDEEIDDLPSIHKIICYDVQPEMLEQKVLGNRLVFRGQCLVHLMYLTEDGAVQHWKAEIPFSQYTELSGDYGPNASAWVLPIMTAAEIEIGDDHLLRLRAGIAAQYTIFDRAMVDVLEDAYSPNRTVTPKIQQMSLPVLLDSMDIDMTVDGTLNDDVSHTVCATAYGEYPTLRIGADGAQVHMDGQFHVLYHNAEGQMMTDSLRFENALPFPSAAENQTQLWVGAPTSPDAIPGGDGFIYRTTYPLNIQVYSGQTIPIVTELELGEMIEPDANRPSIILRRVGDEGLWSIAKSCGSTIAAIRDANQLTDEPQSGQMLLIPVC